MFPINSRFKDVIIGLKISNNHNQNLGRLRLQKFIYLNDIISIYWGVLSSNTGHKTYKNGPYDSDIQNAVDTLAFRGFVKIIDSNIKEDGTVTASYALSKEGLKLYTEMEKSPMFTNRTKLFTSTAMHVDQIGWKNLKALVYAEPTYVYNKINGWGYRLDYSSLLTNDTLRILDDFKKMLTNNNLTRENFMALYFKLLVAKL